MLIASTVESYGLSCTAEEPRGTYAAAWSVEGDAAMPLLCLDTVRTQAGVRTTRATCIEVRPDGTLAVRARMSESDTLGKSVVVRNF